MYLFKPKCKCYGASNTNLLAEWVNGRSEICNIMNITSNDINTNMVNVRIEKVYNIEKSLKFKQLPLKDSREAAIRYVQDCLRRLNLNTSISPPILNSSQVEVLKKNKIHKATPTLLFPIYLFGVIRKQKIIRPQFQRIDNINDKDVWPAYIGKMVRRTGRFERGHAAASKLHGSKYEGCEKKLYLARLFFKTLNGNLEVPVEWVNDLSPELVSDIEHQLIYEFQPELCTQYRNSNVQNPMNIYITNRIRGYQQFLDGYMSLQQ